MTGRPLLTVKAASDQRTAIGRILEIHTASAVLKAREGVQTTFSNQSDLDRALSALAEAKAEGVVEYDETVLGGFSIEYLREN
jgi:hypothetical protein